MAIMPPGENWGHPPIKISQQVGGCPQLPPTLWGIHRVEHVNVEGKCERCTIRRHLMEYSIRKVLRGLMTKNSAIEEMRPGVVEASCLTVI